MRIAFVSQWFPPERGGQVAAAIADGLAQRGHHVDVLTGFPNYPTGHLYPGYSLRPYLRECRSARVTVHRAPLYPSHDSSPVKRAVNYVSFAAAASWIARAKLPPPDVWLTYSSPATAALPALLAARRSRTPTFLIIQDLWPDSVTESQLVSGPTRKISEAMLDRFCNWTYGHAAGIGISSPGMRSLLENRGVPSSKIHSTYNWIENAEVRTPKDRSPDVRRSLGLPTGRLFMYAGNFGQLQALDRLLRAFAMCPEANLVLVGDGSARRTLQAIAAGSGLDNVTFLGPQEPDRAARMIASSDVQIVSLRDTPFLRATMPSKMQHAMASAVPILAHAAGDVAEVVREARAGLTAQPDDLEGTAAAIRQFQSCDEDTLAAMGQRAHAFYLANFAPASGLDRLEAMIGLDSEPTSFQRSPDIAESRRTA